MKTLEELMMDGDPRVLSWLQHEQGRYHTLQHWKYWDIPPYCMAAAGFFKIGPEDIVQCAYCFGVVKDWQQDENPLEVHRKLFPRCPLVTRAPVVNVAATTSEVCCYQHENSEAVMKKRAKSTYQSGTHRTYIPALITLLLALNIAPVRAQTSASPTATSLQPIPSTGTTTDSLYPAMGNSDIFMPVETWKGLLAVKRREFIIPRSYTSYTLRLELSKCTEAETTISQAITTFRATITHKDFTIASTLQTKLSDMLDDANDDLQKENLQDVLSVVDDGTTPSAEIEPPCLADDRHLLSKEQCSDTLREAQIISLGSLTGLAATGGRIGAVAALLDLLHRYQAALQQGRELLKIMQTGEVPREVINIFSGTCKAVYQQCVRNTTAKAANLYRKLTTVTNVKKNDGILYATLVTPCLESGERVGEYHLKSLPHTHSNYSQTYETNPPINKIFVHDQPNSYELVDTKISYRIHLTSHLKAE
jgi:hypothetical protein